MEKDFTDEIAGYNRTVGKNLKNVLKESIFFILRVKVQSEFPLFHNTLCRRLLYIYIYIYINIYCYYMVLQLTAMGPFYLFIYYSKQIIMYASFFFNCGPIFLLCNSVPDISRSIRCHHSICRHGVSHHHKARKVLIAPKPISIPLYPSFSLYVSFLFYIHFASFLHLYIYLTYILTYFYHTPQVFCRLELYICIYYILVFNLKSTIYLRTVYMYILYLSLQSKIYDLFTTQSCT